MSLTPTYQAFPQRVDGVASKLGDDVILITVSIFVNVLHDTKRNFRKI